MKTICFELKKHQASARCVSILKEIKEKMRIIFVLIICIVSLSKIIAQSNQLLSYKKNEHCDYWAETDKECVKNPRFMWADCFGSCLQYAEDNHENCARWAAEGECTENPSYIHLNCPRSCGLAIAWNPWVRHLFEIPEIEIDPNSGKDKFESASNVFAAAETVRDRLEKYAGGLYSVVNGLTSSAPTEYLGMLGLAEGFLYSLRLYEVIFSTMQEMDLRSDHVAKIHHIQDVLRAGYSADKIMIQIPSWIRFLQDASELAVSAIRKHSSSAVTDINDIVRLNSQELSLNTVTDYILNEDPQNLPPNEIFLPEGTKTVPLLNDRPIPLIGLGTWQLEGDECFNTVYEAIKLGYRLIDTAEAYQNEKVIGNAITKAIKDNLVKREDLFIATKLSSPNNAGYMKVKSFIQQQLANLQIDYLDLYMLHSPLENEKLQAETWKGLEELYEQGIIKSIGLSNFDSRELTKLLKVATKVKPMILQNKLDIYHVGKQIDIRGDNILHYAKENKIVMMAYSPFSAYPFVMEPISDPIIQYIALKYSFITQKKVTPAQIILKWIIQRGMTVIPRSSNSNRLKENLETYQLPNLSNEYMKLIDTIQFLVSSPVSVPMLPQ